MPQYINCTIVCLSMLLSSLALGQIPETNPDILRTQNWTIGNNILLEFGDSVKVGSSNLHTSEAYASFSTQSGKLLYYSDAIHLYDSSSNIVSTLKGDKSSVQGVVISGNDSIISVLTTTDIGRTDGAHFYTFKNGVKIQDKKILSPVCEMQARVKHANQHDEWIVLHKFKSDSIYSFLLKNDDIMCPSTFRSQNYFGDKGYNAVGSMKFSPSGRFFCLNHYIFKDDLNGNGNSELYSFNNESGNIDYLYSTNTIRLPISCEFSNDESKIYISERGRSILQYDLLKDNESNFQASTSSIWTSPSSFLDARLQKSGNTIIVNLPDSNHMAEISNLDSISSKVNFTGNGINLGSKIQSYGLPNFNASYFYTPSIDFAYTEDCWWHTYSFEGRDTLGATSWKWIFRDVRNETVDVILGKNVSYTFPQADSLENKYEVTHIASTASRSDTVTKTLTIRPKWEADMLGRDTFYCARSPFDSAQDDFTLTLRAPADMHCVHWGDKGPIEEPNLDESLGLIVDYDHFHTDTLAVDTAGTYIVKVTNKTFCQMWDTITISEYPIPDKSLISRFKDSIVSNTLSHSYRWYRNGEAKFETSVRRLDPDSNGYWQVQLVSEFGCESELSDSLNVGFATLDHRYETLDFRLYPNPSNGNVSIEVPKSGEYRIQVTDLNGKLIYGTTQNLSLIFEFELEFANGTYIITLTDQDGNTGSEKIEVVN